METLVQKYRTLLSRVPLQFERSLTHRINWGLRAIILEGARGTGKSTLMLQHIRNNLDPEKSLYISLDDLFFKQHTLVDVGETFYQKGGRHILADEVHKYPNWQQEIKNLYDFFPDLQLIVSGSSILGLQKSRADLSRRFMRYQLTELSLREYLALDAEIDVPSFDLQNLTSRTNKVIEEITQKISSPLRLFEDYMTYGAYPFFVEGKAEYLMRINQLINVIIDYDLPEAKQMTSGTQAKLKKLLYILSTSVPFKPNIAKLARKVDTSRVRLLEMLHLLEESHLLHNLRSDVHGVSLLNKPDKIFLRNTSLIMTMADGRPDEGNLRETFFLSQLKNAGHTVTWPVKGDFLVDNQYLFEVGGKNKTRKQISGEKHAYIAADDIEYGSPGRVPLWLFGFLY